MKTITINIDKINPWENKTSEYQKKISNLILESVKQDFTSKGIDAFYYAKEVLAPEETGNLRNTMQQAIMDFKDRVVFRFSVSAYDFNEEKEYGKLHELVSDGVYTYHKEGTTNQYILRAINAKFKTNFKHYATMFD